MRMRICVGASHAPGCHHEQYMQQGVERFLAHPRTRDNLALCLARTDHPVTDPVAQAIVILTELARGAELLDGCDTPTAEGVTEGDVDAYGEALWGDTSTTETR